MRLAVALLALLLTIGLLTLSMVGGTALLDRFSALTDSQQRLLSGAMSLVAMFMVVLGAWLRRRRAALAH